MKTSFTIVPVSLTYLQWKAQVRLHHNDETLSFDSYEGDIRTKATIQVPTYYGPGEYDYEEDELEVGYWYSPTHHAIHAPLEEGEKERPLGPWRAVAPLVTAIRKAVDLYEEAPDPEAEAIAAARSRWEAARAAGGHYYSIDPKPVYSTRLVESCHKVNPALGALLVILLHHSLNEVASWSREASHFGNSLAVDHTELLKVSDTYRIHLKQGDTFVTR